MTLRFNSKNQPCTSQTAQKGLCLAIKRTIDVCISGPALILFSPLMAGTAAAIWFTMGWPIFFRQQRPGRHGRIFSTNKFRTMSETLDDKKQLLSDSQRLTPLGRIIRRYSLDELPQLWNVMKGDMSLVGPRPLLVQYLPRYSPNQLRRHDVLPGITGWAQIKGRNETTWDARLAQDLWYVDNWSLPLDLKIMAITLFKILTGDGITPEGRDTMPEFMGNEPDTELN
ncbi:MAG: sugar transferase [Pseudomonadota bacterium]